MEKIILTAQDRGVGRHAVRQLRLDARVPAVIYGAHQEPQSISVVARELHRALHAAGSGLLTLEISGQEPIQALAREVQRHPVSHRFLHVDFQTVSMTEKLRLNVPIVTAGIAPAVSTEIVLVRHMEHVEVECLPSDIPNHLVADLTTLKALHDHLLVKDLQIPANVKVLTDANHAVYSLTVSRAAVEEVAAATPTADAVEVVAKGKIKEGAEEEAAPAKK